jgi:hypothetical protein
MDLSLATMALYAAVDWDMLILRTCRLRMSPNLASHPLGISHAHLPTGNRYSERMIPHTASSTGLLLGLIHKEDLGEKSDLGPVWNVGIFSYSCVFFCENKLIPVKFLHNSCEILVFQTDPYW